MFTTLKTPTYACPHCGKPCISPLRKLGLGPASTAKCRSCHQSVSVGAGSLTAILPFLAAFLIIRHAALPFAGSALLLIIGVAISAYILHRHVPLVQR